MKKNKLVLFLAVILSSIFLFNCEDRNDLTVPEQVNSHTSALLKNFVAIGNSLTAGKQSSSVYETAQEYSYGKMIADQVGVTYEQPLIQDPGIGGRIDITSISPFATKTQPDNETRLNGDYAGIYNNLGIPGILLVDVLQTKVSPSAYVGPNAMIDAVLRNQGHTVLELAIASSPSLVTLWIGNNDILGYATSGGLLPHTPIETFGQLYTMLAGGLAQAGIKTVVANIPNVKDVPFFTTVGPSVGLGIKQVQAVNPAVKGLVYQLSVAPFIGVATVEDLLTNKVFVTLKASAAAAFLGDATGAYYTTFGIDVPAGVDVTQPFGLTQQNPFPNGLIIDPAEQQIIETVTASFNASIASAAASFGFALVDINDFFGEVSANGHVENGVSFSTQYVSGGLFSLDGVHPTSQGYAVIANQFIEGINSSFQANITKINVSTIPGSLELAKSVEYDKYGIPTFERGTFDGYLF